MESSTSTAIVQPRAAPATLDKSPVEVTAVAVTMADRINEQHALAEAHRDDAIKHAVACGELLIAQKKKVKHGQFQKWIKTNCRFEYSTAARYMKAAEQFSTGVEISKISDVFPSGRAPATGLQKFTLHIQRRRRDAKKKETTGRMAIDTFTRAVDEYGAKVHKDIANNVIENPITADVIEKVVTIERALEMLKGTDNYLELWAPILSGRRLVTQYRSKLEEAEQKLAAAEAAAIKAAKELP